uniref:Uncharacterized protein n=1 Tax=Picea glauca TaxID=3330 RepID=A0A101M399_PICGL|nr:hypothetical protein ABT39_MTgene3268 [Picea glauca]QHR89227.1 hypothetical protein Q903MT_gene3247 [Picea sitchensis]
MLSCLRARSTCVSLICKDKESQCGCPLAFMLPSMPLYMLVMLLRLEKMEPDLHMPLFQLSLP